MAITYERLKELRFLGVTLETQVCVNCEHFYQHYHKDGSLIFAGHCCYPRMKYRSPHDTCEHFKNKEPRSPAP